MTFPTECPSEAVAEAILYARSLHEYAAPRLDAFSLRCWIIQRLMLDLELEHETAERACSAVLSPNQRVLPHERGREGTRPAEPSAPGAAQHRFHWRAPWVVPHIAGSEPAPMRPQAGAEMLGSNPSKETSCSTSP